MYFTFTKRSFFTSSTPTINISLFSDSKFITPYTFVLLFFHLTFFRLFPVFSLLYYYTKKIMPQLAYPLKCKAFNSLSVSYFNKQIKKPPFRSIIP